MYNRYILFWTNRQWVPCDYPFICKERTHNKNKITLQYVVANVNAIPPKHIDRVPLTHMAEQLELPRQLAQALYMNISEVAFSIHKGKTKEIKIDHHGYRIGIWLHHQTTWMLSPASPAQYTRESWGCFKWPFKAIPSEGLSNARGETSNQEI